ncbi:MAG: hypothetical protein A2045_00710 [Rhodocyclales bacterium GWA2_65_20]|nr:MAG: hypothetical protein A2045_00710 [Rhodocyclales bacterium GWA2_65_20]
MSSITESTFVDSRLRLIQAATEAFMKEGYRASVDSIAARAGVAKQTLYNHFPSKNDLFSEVARLASSSILVTLEDGSRDVRERLLSFAAAFSAKVLGEEGLAYYRVMIAETARFPDLAQAFFVKGPEQTASCLAEFLDRAMAAGSLRRDDPRFAAELLLSMLVGYERTRRLLAGPSATSHADGARIEQTVDCFLRAYAPERASR